jgi:hypothetical protein
MPLLRRKILRALFFVRKGRLRLATSEHECRDGLSYCRWFNAVTIKDRCPVPLMDERLDGLGGNRGSREYKYVTVLDMFSGFCQVVIDENRVYYLSLIMNVYVVRRLMNNKLGRLSTYSSVPVCGRYDNSVVPRAARWQIVKLCHDQARHLGVENTLRKIQQKY